MEIWFNLQNLVLDWFMITSSVQCYSVCFGSVSAEFKLWTHNEFPLSGTATTKLLQYVNSCHIVGPLHSYNSMQVGQFVHPRTQLEISYQSPMLLLICFILKLS